MNSAFLDVVREVGTEGSPTISVLAFPDDPSLVCVSARGRDAIEYWGPIHFGIPPGMARLLAKALLACADEVEGKQ